MLELAVAIELVAKEISETDDSGRSPPRDLRQGSLVHLEQAELGAPGGEQRRRDTGHEIRAGRIVGQAHTRREDLPGHGRRGRLAVRRGHEHATEREAARKAVEGGRIENRDHLSRNSRAAPGAEEPREARRGPGGRDPDRKGDAHVHGVSLAGKEPDPWNE